MDKQTFKAVITEETTPGNFHSRVGTKSINDLPAGDVVIKVQTSSVNYKDALSMSGHKGITQNYPHTPGIDAAGVIVESKHPSFAEGDPVIVTGYDLGMNTSGGFGAYIRVPANWVVPCPDGLTLDESMIFGTAGFTAAMSLTKLQAQGLHPDKGTVLVTGATGGVGSIAVAILAHCGFRVAAVTGKPEAHPFLKKIGATEILTREDFMTNASRGLLKERWAGVIDTVGGPHLAAALKSTVTRGSVTTCGMVTSPDLTVTMFPFILRGVNLLGIDSAETPLDDKKKIWNNLAGPWKPKALQDIVQEWSLEDVCTQYQQFFEGNKIGRTIVRHALAVN